MNTQSKTGLKIKQMATTDQKSNETNSYGKKITRLLLLLPGIIGRSATTVSYGQGD